jgi:hypothetical protein
MGEGVPGGRTHLKKDGFICTSKMQGRIKKAYILVKLVKTTF